MSSDLTFRKPKMGSLMRVEENVKAKWRMT